MRKRLALICPMLMMALVGCSQSTNNELEYGTYYQWNGSAEEIKITSETETYRIIEITSKTLTFNYFNENVLKSTEKSYFIRGNSLFTEKVKEGEESTDEIHYEYDYDFGKGYLKYVSGGFGSSSKYSFYITKSFAKKLGVTISDEVYEK